MQIDTLLADYYAHQKKLTIMNGIGALLARDQEANLPAKAGSTRATQQGFLGGLYHQYATDPDYVHIVEQLADQLASLDAKDQRSVALAKKSIDKQRSLSQSFVEQFEEVKSAANHARADAKKNNDFAAFAPHLEKVLDMTKEYASLVAPGKDPYDVLLDEYEEGMTQADYDALLLPLRAGIVALTEQQQKTSRDESYTITNFPHHQAHALLNEMVSTVGFDLERGLVGEVHHPFATCLGPHDERINTRYYHLIETIYSTVHEMGHGLYDQRSPAQYDWTNLAGGSSLGIHESQSRLVENIIGRSKPYVQFIDMLIKKYLPAETAHLTVDGLYAYVNQVIPSLIRVQADEVTYNLHVLLRYEIEKEMMSGALAVKDIPEAWNTKMHNYLGITPSTDSDGCLQDVHRSFGLIGYFPTYMLGNIISGQLWHSFITAHPDRAEKVAAYDFTDYIARFDTHIRQHASRYTAEELVEKATGSSLSADYYMNYLTEKYT